MYASDTAFARRMVTSKQEEAAIRAIMAEWRVNAPPVRRRGKLSAGDHAMAALAQAQTPAQALQANMAVRQNILANSIPVFQNVRSGSLSWAQGVPTQWTVLASNVGFIRRFWIEISGTVNGSAAATFTPSLFGLTNILSNVQFIDQNNRLRINTTGPHLHLAASQKRRRPFGAAITNAATGDDAGIGSNLPVQVSTGVVTAGTPKNFTIVYEIPVVNSNQDLTGGIYANQTTSNNQLQFTLNPNAFVFGADAFNACYLASSALGTSLPTLTNLKWTLYQDFLDQLPVDNTGFAQLPQIDIAYALVYQMINPGPVVAAQDNLYALPPFNVYQDLMLFWDNYTYNTSPVGSDVNYVKVQIANTYILLQQDPLVNAIRSRNLIGSDFPATIAATNTSGAVYDLDFRHKPLSVNQLSSTNVVFNPAIVATAASNLQIGQEYIWYANQAAA